MKHTPKLDGLRNETKQARTHAHDLAIQLLSSGAVDAYVQLRQAYEEFERKWLAMARYADKLQRGSWNVMSTFTSYMTIVELYYDLPDLYQSLWDANPDLFTWKQFNGTARN